MWRRRKRRLERCDGPTADESCELIEESVAFLSGRYGDFLMAHKRPIPAWAWINRLSHGGLDDIRALATHDPGPGPAAVVADLAAQLVSLVETQHVSLASIQSRILIPLEMRLADMRSTQGPQDAREMAQLLKDAMGGIPQIRPVTGKGRPGTHAPRRQFHDRTDP